jgi:O-antigen/teichoic acid export membrane protein
MIKERFKYLFTFINNSQTFKNYFSNTSWLFLEKGIRFFLIFFVGIYVSRFLGPEQFGKLSFALHFIILGLPLSSLGLDSIVIKELVNKEFTEREILGTSFFLKLVSSVFTYTFLVLIYRLFFNTDPVTEKMILVIAVASIFLSANIIEFYFRAKVKSKYTVFALTIAAIGASATRLYFVEKKFSVIYFSYTYLLEYSLLAISYFTVATLKKNFLWRWQISIQLGKKLVRESWPLILSGMLVTINITIDQVMLKKMMSDNAIGNYAAAVKITELWYVIPMLLSNSLLPLMNKTYNENYPLYIHRLKTIMFVFFWFFLTIGVVIAFYSKEIIFLIYGEQYVYAHEALQIHIYSCAIASLGMIYSQKFIFDKKTKMAFFGSFCGAASNILINLYFIPNYGIQGAAIATLISFAIPTIAITLFFDRSVGTLYFQSLFYLKKYIPPSDLQSKN